MSVTWVDDLPADKPLENHRSRPRSRSLFDDPRFDKDWNEDDRLYGDVVPIPFFPDDLPTLKPSEFGWTPAELQSAVAYAKGRLFNSRTTRP